MRFVFVIVLLAATSASCTALKPYEKEFLLDPTMDDETVTPLTPDVMSSASGSFEKLGQGAGSGGATSCPTCGG